MIKLEKIGSSETIRKTTFNFNNYAKNTVSHQTKINKDFLEWFIGFTEGDGSFIVSNNRLFFIINQKEEKILYSIRQNLGFGKVSTYKTYSRFIVADKTNIDRLISIFNGNLVLNKTNERFISWLHARNTYVSNLNNSLHTNKICLKKSLFKKACCINKGLNLPKVISKIEYLNKNKLVCFENNAWLSGFIDAEGCFNAIKIKDVRYSLGFRVRLRFILDQKNEKKIFYKIQDFLQSKDCGVISNRTQIELMFRFTSTSISSHEILIKYLERYSLRTLKKVSFLRFCSLLRYIKNRKTLVWKGKVLQKIENLLKNI